MQSKVESRDKIFQLGGEKGPIFQYMRNVSLWRGNATPSKPYLPVFTPLGGCSPLGWLCDLLWTSKRQQQWCRVTSEANS